MSAKQHLVRLLAAAVAALVSCLFVSGYSLACSLSYPPNYPAFTQWIFRNARYAYALPIAMLILGVWLLRSRQDRPVALECLVSLLWIGAFVWVLTAILAWQLVHIELWSGAGRNLR
jgi:hypothetical protein